MKALLVSLTIFAFAVQASAIEIVVEENGNKRIVKVPDDRNQDVVVKIDTKNSSDPSPAMTPTAALSSCVSCGVGQQAVSPTPVVQPSVVGGPIACVSCPSQVPCATNAQPPKIKAKKTVKKITPRAQKKESSIYQEKNNVAVTAVYHYFYPCSVNPSMDDCVIDKDIRIDKDTNRLVVQRENGPSPVDIINKKSHLVAVNPVAEMSDRASSASINNNAGDSSSSPVPISPNAPVFDKNAYQDGAIPMSSKRGRISETYGNKRIVVADE